MEDGISAMVVEASDPSALKEVVTWLLVTTPIITSTTKDGICRECGTPFRQDDYTSCGACEGVFHHRCWLLHQCQPEPPPPGRPPPRPIPPPPPPPPRVLVPGPCKSPCSTCQLRFCTKGCHHQRGRHICYPCLQSAYPSSSRIPPLVVNTLRSPQDLVLRSTQQQPHQPEARKSPVAGAAPCIASEKLEHTRHCNNSIPPTPPVCSESRLHAGSSRPWELNVHQEEQVYKLYSELSAANVNVILAAVVSESETPTMYCKLWDEF